MPNKILIIPKLFRFKTKHGGENGKRTSRRKDDKNTMKGILKTKRRFIKNFFKTSLVSVSGKLICVCMSVNFVSKYLIKSL